MGGSRLWLFRTGQSSGSGPVDIYSAAKAIPRFGVPYDEEGNIITNPCGSTTNVYTVIDEWNKSTDNRQTFRALGSFYGQFDFGKIWAPLEGLSYKISFGPDFRHYRQGIFISKDSAVKMGSKTMLNMQQIVTCHGHWIIRSTITRHSANIT